MNVLILCTGNSCRSQMAHGFLKSFDSTINVHSAGTQASGKLNLFYRDYRVRVKWSNTPLSWLELIRNPSEGIFAINNGEENASLIIC